MEWSQLKLSPDHGAKEGHEKGGKQMSHGVEEDEVTEAHELVNEPEGGSKSGEDGWQTPARPPNCCAEWLTMQHLRPPYNLANPNLSFCPDDAWIADQD